MTVTQLFPEREPETQRPRHRPAMLYRIAMDAEPAAAAQRRAAPLRIPPRLVAETGAARRRPRRIAVARPGFALDEAAWGYAIRALSPAPLWLRTAQAGSYGLGICLAVAALGLWLLPGSGASGLFAIKLGMSAVIMGLAACLLWFASRAAMSELQIDTIRAEIRVVLRHRRGRPTCIARHDFSEIGGVFLDRSALRHAGHACLMLRFGDTARLLPVVAGPVDPLEELRDRIGRDVLAGQGIAPQLALSLRPRRISA